MAIAGGKMNYQFIKWVKGASRPAPSSSPRQIRKFFCVKRNSSSYNAQLIIISVVELQQVNRYGNLFHIAYTALICKNFLLLHQKPFILLLR